MREAERPLANPKMREAESCNVRVLARFRPLSEREPAVELAVDASARRVELTADGVREAFTLDRVFGTEATQREVYENAAAPLAADICAGFNATLMAYGQTGSGKTFTMYGPCAAGELPEPSAAGILPRVTAQVFDAIRADTRGASFSIGTSYLEVYREKVRDLLNPNPHADAAGLKISESLERGVFVKGATTVCVRRAAPKTACAPRGVPLAAPLTPAPRHPRAFPLTAFAAATWAARARCSTCCGWAAPRVRWARL